MKLGQTSVIVFISRVLGAALGFLTTLYFARELGAEVLGVYSLVLTAVAWIILFADLGIGQALIKRISEGNEQGSYLSAALISVLLLAVILSIAVVAGRQVVESYIGEFSQYVASSPVWFIIALIFTKLCFRTIVRVLKGERKVHVAGFLTPVKTGSQSLLQLGFVVAGLGLFGMLVGAITGAIIIGIIGLIWVTVRPARPARRHFQSLVDYAKFSWLGNLQSRAFNEVDILLLGVFVQSSVVGVYSVVWSLAKFLDLFGTAIRSTLFPELSYKSTQDSDQATTGLIEDSLAYTGLIATPGLIGGLLIGDRLLRLYGGEFTSGDAVLGLLILAILLSSYQKQLMSGLNGLDRPNLAFRVNGLFVVLNTALNLILIPRYSIEGAAIASILSTAVSLVFSYHLLSELITFTFPTAQVSRQWVAALVMGGVVLAARWIIEATPAVNNNSIIVIFLVGLGGGVYFLTLLMISRDFRTITSRNLPINMPL